MGLMSTVQSLATTMLGTSGNIEKYVQDSNHLSHQNKITLLCRIHMGREILAGILRLSPILSCLILNIPLSDEGY